MTHFSSLNRSLFKSGGHIFFPLDKLIFSEYPIDRLISIELIDIMNYKAND